MAENAQTAERGLLTNFQNTKDRLDKISPSFCLAKWNQVTIHLSNGTTHSCHHPEPHKVGLDEIKRKKAVDRVFCYNQFTWYKNKKSLIIVFLPILLIIIILISISLNYLKCSIFS